jgi:large subunit ribosomal protein L9
MDEISFTLTKTTTGKVRIGYKAGGGGSANSAKLVIDYVQLIGENMTIDKTTLSERLSEANSFYGDGTGTDADLLKAAIDEVLKEEDFMKVILQENVKNKGKKGEILEFATDQAKELIANGSAIEATAENLRMIEQEKQEEAQEALVKQKELYELKDQIEKEPLTIYVATDEQGHILEMVNTKTIAVALEKAVGQKIDRRKVLFAGNVNTLGLYEAQIKLSNDIYATLVIHVLEKPSN